MSPEIIDVGLSLQDVYPTFLPNSLRPPLPTPVPSPPCFSEFSIFCRDVTASQVQRVILSAGDDGACLSNLIPAEGGSGSFNLSLKDPFTGRTDTTGPLNFDASANEASKRALPISIHLWNRYHNSVRMVSRCPRVIRGIETPVGTVYNVLVHKTLPQGLSLCSTSFGQNFNVAEHYASIEHCL